MLDILGDMRAGNEGNERGRIIADKLRYDVVFYDFYQGI
jgi:hypothetical protein